MFADPRFYNTAHIGNARPPVVFDTLFRLLRHVYGEVALSTRNYTDIDDKQRSIERGDFSRAVERQYEAMGALNVLLPTLRLRDREWAMISVIEKLIAKGAAAVPTGVYFPSRRGLRQTLRP